MFRVAEEWRVGKEEGVGSPEHIAHEDEAEQIGL